MSKRSNDPARISDYFAWGEVTRSEKAITDGIDNTLPADLKKGALRLHDSILWLLRHDLGHAVHVSSWYRSPRLNRAIGGAEQSYHQQARAADIFTHHMTPAEIVAHIVDMKMRFDKVIHEHGRWCHVQVAKEGERPRLEVWTAHIKHGRTRYAKGNLPVDPATGALA